MDDWQGDLSALEALGYMFNQQVECDVIFNVRGEVIGAHRSVLEARSSVLMKMLEKAPSSTSPIRIDNMDIHTFRAVLEYLYTDEIDVTENNIFLLLHAAADFNMRHLEKRCLTFIGGFLHPHNLCTFANKAQEYDALKFCGKFNEVFSTNTMEVIDSYQFTELSQSVLASLLDTDQVTVLEIELFDAVIRWAGEDCRRRHLDVNGNNMRDVLGSALYKIRFPTISIRDFSNKVTSIEGLLTDSEIAQVFKKMTMYDSENLECPFSDHFRCKVKFGTSLTSGTAANMLSQAICRHTNGQNQSLGNVLLWWNGSGHDLPRSAAINIIDTCTAMLNGEEIGSILDAKKTDSNLRRQVLQVYNDFASFLQQHPANFKSSKNLSEALELARHLIHTLGVAK